MRLLIFAVLLATLGFSSCEKYQLKQPAHLHFKWNFFEQSAGESKAVVESGYFYLKDFTVQGEREKGPGVAITQAPPFVLKTSFKAQGDLGLTMDIPVGEYNQFELKMNITDETQPCLVLFGTITRDGLNHPFRVEWDADQELSFHAQTPFTLKKKNDYNLTMGLNVQKLLNEQDWSLATLTNEQGVETYVIRAAGQNYKLFMDINEDLQNSLVLNIE